MKVSPAPHIRDEITGERMMADTILSLLPATLFGIILFGLKALVLIITSIITAVLFEKVIAIIRKKQTARVDISSAALTGLLLALCLPPRVPVYLAIVGAGVAIFFSKALFGGLGYNIFNPALIGRAFLTASWPVYMTTWLKPFDAITGATPLALAKSHALPSDFNIFSSLFIGIRGGCIGETSAIALLLGASFLLLRKVIDWRIPVSYLSTVALISAIFGQNPIFQLLAGGLLLGALFMATDPVTTPVTKPGRFLFGIGCGMITMVLRLWGGYPEGVCYSILLMNAVTPLLDRYLRGRIFGR